MQRISVPHSATHPDTKNGTASFPFFLNLEPNFAAQRERSPNGGLAQFAPLWPVRIPEVTIDIATLLA